MAYKIEGSGGRGFILKLTGSLWLSEACPLLVTVISCDHDVYDYEGMPIAQPCASGTKTDVVHGLCVHDWLPSWVRLGREGC